MNKTFFNSKLSVITPEKFDRDLPNFCVKFHGKISSVVNDIKMYEYENDEFFNAHLIINDEKKFNELLEYYTYNDFVAPLFNEAYFLDVHHTGPDHQCFVNDDVALIGSYVLPFYGYTNRTPNKVYGNMIRHRIKFYKFNKLII